MAGFLSGFANSGGSNMGMSQPSDISKDEATTETSANGGSGGFPTNAPDMTSKQDVPDPNKIIYPNQVGAGSSNSSSSSSSGGGLGGIGDIISKGIGFLGGLFAKGGPVKTTDPHSAGIGFLVGSLHQHKYGGDPAHLQDAINEAKSIVMGNGSGEQQPKMAQGGEVQSPGINAAISQAMGLSDPSQTPSHSAQMTLQNPSAGMDQPFQGSPLGSPTNAPNPGAVTQMEQGSVGGNLQDRNILNMLQGQSQGQSGLYSNGTQEQKVGKPAMKKGGYMDETNMPIAQPSMYAKGGEAFQGDGSVKGPGTATSDSIDAKLSNGEFVFSQPAVQFFGVDKLTKMNEQGKQGFMESMAQVQQNQMNSPQGDPGQQQQAAPSAPSMAMPAPQGAAPTQMPSPSTGMSKGGVSMKQAGYCGL